jgi:hypothetical protein
MAPDNPGAFFFISSGQGTDLNSEKEGFTMPRKPSLAVLLLILLAAVSVGCGSRSPNNQCVITTATTPQSATADHTQAAPGDQVQFALHTSINGGGPCPEIADYLGVWSTSDPVNTSISNTPPTQGLATCVNATTAPATISNSSLARGHSYPSVTLTCK